MAAAVMRDDPWRRLPWLLPTAALLALISLMGFLKLLAGPPLTLALAPPIEVDVIELAPSPPAPRALPAPAPPMGTPPPLAETRPTPPLVQSLPPPPPLATRPQRAAPTPALPPRPALAATTPPSPAPAAPVASAPPSGGTTGARALYQPLPEIPDELRRRAIDLVAVARFRVADNGSAEVELIQPTPDATLNRALLEALKKWRFFPALEAGKPVASSMEIRIPLSVR